MNPPIDVEQGSFWDLPPPTPRRAREVMFASSDVAVKTRIAILGGLHHDYWRAA